MRVVNYMVVKGWVVNYMVVNYMGLEVKSRVLFFVCNLDTESNTQSFENRKEQIGILRDESQWIVAQRPLSALTIPRYGWIVCPGFPVRVMWTKLNPVPFNGHAVSFDVGT